MISWKHVIKGIVNGCFVHGILQANFGGIWNHGPHWYNHELPLHPSLLRSAVRLVRSHHICVCWGPRRYVNATTSKWSFITQPFSSMTSDGTKRDLNQANACCCFNHCFPFLTNIAGVNLSLLSRVMSSRLARGTYNGGLLSTEAGTLARVVADATITAAGYLGPDLLLNITLLPPLVICIASLVATFCTYNTLY